ncbi:nuclear transport factor 2 family protein [Larkinella terrae]|uniref:Nuclear transport factor 2 family protein n=1 Tax=Larkinella terrae TaxID=2025311 RepID=A0A7K0EEF1_9BACT|nr:nuclear transport factor 2 family protein [Larkinella terrae]MRS60197.1 nuclear transport factor 2 family protein [Larkinella terrae]
MNLPKVVADLVLAQNNFDSVGYATCFSETAVVFDEGKTHNGRKEIAHWIADANERYKATMKPISFEENETESLLKVEVSGDFDGSPVVLSYHLEIADEWIQSLKITG